MESADGGILELTIINFEGFSVFRVQKFQVIEYTAFKSCFCEDSFCKFALMEGATCKFCMLKIDGIKFDIVKNTIFPNGVWTSDIVNSHGRNVIAFERGAG